MRIARVWLLLLAGACSAVPAPEREAPGPDREPAARSSPEPEPAQSAPEPGLRIRGWYCFEARRKAGDAEFISTCKRTLDACMYFRRPDRYDGHFTECRPRRQAACYHVEDPIERSNFYHCFTTLDECHRTRDQSIERDPPRLIHGPCRVLD